VPQPIDPTTEINRTAAVERIQQMIIRADVAAQLRLAANAAREQVEAESVVDRPDPKDNEVDRDLRRRNPFSGRRRHKQEPETPTEARTFYTPDEHVVVLEEEQQHGLDISV